MSAELACENTVMPCRLISRSWGNVPPTPDSISFTLQTLSSPACTKAKGEDSELFIVRCLEHWTGWRSRQPVGGTCEEPHDEYTHRITMGLQDEVKNDLYSILMVLHKIK